MLFYVVALIPTAFILNGIRMLVLTNWNDNTFLIFIIVALIIQGIGGFIIYKYD